MWPRGRFPRPQNQSSSNYSSYPITLGFNQYPQPDQGNSTRGSSQNFNFGRHLKRERLRPRRPGYSYYSDESNNSNFSHASSRGSRGGYSRGGTGIINAAIRNLPPKQPLQDRRNNNDNRGEQSRVENDYRPETARGQNKENRNRSREKQISVSDAQQRSYLCPKCGENYCYRQTQNKYIGKIPLILHCNHTICQECSYQNCKNNKVNCPICETDSVLTQEQTPVCQTDMQKVFPPNFYIIGIITYFRPQGGYLGNLENIKLVSTAAKKQLSLPDPSERCCFAACSKPATMYCPSCEGIYCVDCCTVVHKSTKKLMSHQPVPRRREKFSLALENCGVHPSMQVEFFCKTCDLTACCYCVLDDHSDHERVPLYHLNETEMEEFKNLKKTAGRALREVLHTQKKTARLVNFNTGSVKKDVCQYFADLHAKIENLEKKLCDDLENFKSNNRGLDAIQASLMSSAEQLKQLVSFNVDKIGDKKLNLRGALERLRDIGNIPRFLLNENGSTEPVRFVVNSSSIDTLEDDFVIEKSEDSDYRLVNEKDLPDDYVIDADDSDSEVEENMNAIMTQSNQSDEVSTVTKTDQLKLVSVSEENSKKKVQKHTKPSQSAKRKLEMERIAVQHINSMDSFFIHHKNDQQKLVQLNKEIENYVKMGGAQPVEHPQLNDLYLALYVTDSQNQKEQRWCRARLTEIKNGETGPLYEMFFIDYGKTQTVDGSRIKDIPAFLAHKKPFAIECMLHNPMSVNWNKKAHFSLAKILNGKDVYMMVKSYNSGIHEVELMIASSDGGVTSVTDILVHATNSVDPINDDNGSVDSSISLRKDGYLPMLRVFPNSKKFTKNQKEKVVIANIVDPHNIFVHLVQHQDAFKAMNHSIKKAYKMAKANGCIPIEGTYVLVEYRDVIRSNWHRAFVKSVDLNSDQVYVLLVDWGINVCVPTTSIRPLQERFTKLESQAVLVKLAHIAPYDAQATWSPHAANFLQNYLRSQDVLKMVVQEVEGEVQVALFDITSNVEMCLNAMLVENNLADSTGPISTQVEWPQFEVKNAAFSEEEGLMASMLKKVDEDSDEEEVPVVKKHQIDVIKVEGPDLIWIKFVDTRAKECKMFKELQIHYSQEQPTKTEWEEGEQCVVEADNEYGRGKILEKVGENYKVQLIDKIKDVILPLNKIFVYDTYFMTYNQTVFKSHLAYIRPAGGAKWSISSVEALQEIFSTHQRIYGCRVEDETDQPRKSVPMDMWYGVVIQGGPLEPDVLKYKSINNFLVKLGFAYNVPRPQKPSTSSVKTAKNGEDLLKVLTKEQEVDLNSSEDKGKTEESADTSESNKSGDAKSGEKEDKKESKKGKGKKVNPKGVKTEKDVKEASNTGEKEAEKSSEDQKVEQVRNEPRKNKKDARNKGTKRDDTDKVAKNWIDVVEEELGEPGPRPKTLRGDDEARADSGEGDVPGSKVEQVINDWLPPFRLTKNDFRARVTCVETSGNLYVHEEATDAAYYKMEANMKEYFDKNPPELCDDEWQPGQLCTIKYDDGKWYRGKVLKVKGPREISVLMIDFGSDHDVTPDVLFRELLYTDMNPFATKVKLEKVYAKSGSWLSSDYDHFHDLVTDWCRIVVKGPLTVELPLVEVYNEFGIFVNQRLVEVCPNLSRCPIFPIEQGVDEDDAALIESIESEDYIAKEMILENVNEEMTKRSKPARKSSPLKKHKSLLKYRKRPLPEELVDGKKVLLEIGGLTNYSMVALKTPGEDVSEEMYDLITEIQDSVESQPNLADLRVGMPCLAPFSEDGVWYRARISCVQAIEVGFVDVLFVDYGNSEAISVENIKEIPPDYLELPQQTWEAALNVELTEDADTMSVMQVMRTLLDKKKKLVQIVKKDPLTVDIYDKDDNLTYQSVIDGGSIKRLHEEHST